MNTLFEHISFSRNRFSQHTMKNISLQFLKRRMSFEWRKGLHFLSIIWVLSLMNHAPQRIFWLVGVPFFIYCGDKLFGVVSRTYLLENCYFERLSDSFCLITFQNPNDFDEFNAAYVYLVLPWVSVSMELSFLDSLSIITYRKLQSCVLSCRRHSSMRLRYSLR